MLAAALTVSAIAPPACEIRAAQQSLSSVTEEAQILPMGDGSGKYMMKSDGFYCLDVSGARSTTEEVHYFHNFELVHLFLFHQKHLKLFLYLPYFFLLCVYFFYYIYIIDVYFFQVILY